MYPLLVGEAVMLHTGDRVMDILERKGTIMGEIRYRRMWYKIVLWDGHDEPNECLAVALRLIND